MQGHIVSECGMAILSHLQLPLVEDNCSRATLHLPDKVIRRPAMDSIPRLPGVLNRDSSGGSVGVTLHPGICVIYSEEAIHLQY